MPPPAVFFILLSAWHTPCNITFAIPCYLSSLIRPIVLVSPLPRSYFSQRFFFPSLPSAPSILPVENFPIRCPVGDPVPSFSSYYSRLNILTIPTLFLPGSTRQRACLLMTDVLHQAPRQDSAIFRLALKATRKLWLLPFAANSPYRQSNLTFPSSSQSTNFIKISLSHASPQTHLRRSASSISSSLSRMFPPLFTHPNSKLFTEPTPTRLFRTPSFCGPQQITIFITCLGLLN